MAGHEDEFDDYPVQGFTTDPPTTSRYQDGLDEGTEVESAEQPDWNEIARFVSETASHVLEEFFDSEAESVVYDSSTVHDVQVAVPSAPLPPPPPQVPPSHQARSTGRPSRLSSSETIEVELGDLSDDELGSDVFSQTGIQFIDVDTGDLISTEDVEKATRAQNLPNLGLQLPGVESKRLPGIWGRFLTELKEEILAEPDVGRRAAYVYVFSNVVRALTGEPASNDVFESLADDSGGVLRSNLLERLAFHWKDADEAFFQLMTRLERLDGATEENLGSIRRSSIAFERLLDGHPAEATRQRLRDRMVPPETFPALVVKAVEGHASRNLVNSVGAWRRLGKHANGELKRAAGVMVPWLLHGNPAFFEVVDQMIADGSGSRPVLAFLQREAHDQGNWLDEARALKRLVAQDARIGQKAQNETEPARKRLMRESAGRLFRLATILERLRPEHLEGTELAGLNAYRVLRDAVSLHASNFVMLRQLERWARARGDLATVEQALVSQAELVDDEATKALIWERLAALHEQTTADLRIMAEYLQMSLAADPDCLPTLISLGQQMILHNALGEMLELKGVPSGEEMRAVQNAWRRAELLERTGGDAREILGLYRSARDENPESVHLFFCVERALARVGDWRGVRTLYDVCLATDELTERLNVQGGIHQTRLAVEAFLEDGLQELGEDWRRHFERYGYADEGAFWRVAAADVARGGAPEVLARLEPLEFETRADVSVRRQRLLMWMGWLSASVNREARATVEVFRELFAGASGIFQRRFALMGLLRHRDFVWVAERVAEGDVLGFALPVGDPDDAYVLQLAAELFALGGDYDRALATFSEALEACDDPTGRGEIAERALHHAIRSRRWSLGLRFLPLCFEGEDPRAVAEFARHVAACSDDAAETLRRIDEAGMAVGPAPVVILDELELAYVARDWKRASRLIGQGLATAEAGSIDFRAFLLEQEILVGAWGWDAPEETIACLDDLWSLDASLPSASPFFAVAAYLRTYTRLGRREKVAEWSAFAQANFTAPVAEALMAEARVYSEAKSGIEASRWYRDRTDRVPGPLQPYYRWMAAVLAWMFEPDRANAVQELVGATSAGDPTHKVGTYLVAIAQRKSDPEGMARQLRMMRRAGNSRAVQQWAMVRGLFHLATTQNAPDRAMELMEEEAGLRAFEWSSMAEELFSRSLRRTQAAERLRGRIKTARGARALSLELAQILGDIGMFPRLAASGLAPAQVLVELLTAQGELSHAPGWNIELRFADLQRSIAEESQEQVRRRLMAYLLEVDEVVIGSPWCPVRLVHSDLTRFGLSIDELNALKARVMAFGQDDMAAEARLVVARQFHRMGQREAALSMMPAEISASCVSQAWALFGHTLDPFSSSPRAAAWALGLWSQRKGWSTSIEAEIEYELGHYHEVVGDEEAALKAFHRSLDSRPNFLAAQVAAGRLLIRRRDFEGLAAILDKEYHAAKSPDAQASLAFRLGYVWDRRLRGAPQANAHAESWYLRVLRQRPNHVPTLEALLEIAFRTQNWEAASQYLAHLADLARAPRIQAAYLTELGTILEHQLNNEEAALDAYDRALHLDPDDALAFLGVLRTSRTGDRGLAAIVRRLDLSRSPREIDDLSHLLFVLARGNSRAREAMKIRFPHYYAVHLTSLAEALENRSFDAASAVALERNNDPQTRLVVVAFERLGKPRPLSGNELLLESRVGADPFSEGRLIRAMHHAWRERNLEALGLLATSRARRATSPLLRSAELTWMVATEYMRGDRRGSLELIERLLAQFMDFVPAVKFAKLVSQEMSEWESVVRWFKRDAYLTRVAGISAADRLYASEVQRSHLGDLDAAVEQLRKIIETEPRHPEAFGRLKDLLWQRREFSELLAAYENQIRHSQSADEISGWLNEMADIALKEQKSAPHAIAYLTRSLETRGGQPRRLRQLGELYEQAGSFEKAIQCYAALTRLLEPGADQQRLFAHIGQLFEGKLGRPNEAKSAYLSALRLEGNHTPTLMALARVCEARMEHQEALRYLARVMELSRDVEVLRVARVSTFRLQGKANVGLEELLASGGTVLLHHPEQLETVDELRRRLVRAGKTDEVQEFFRNLAVEHVRSAPNQALSAHFEIARRLDHHDRAFRLASLAMWTQTATSGAREYYQSRVEPRRWPKRAIPSEATAGLLPADLVVPFVELLRLSREGVEEATDIKGVEEHIRRNSRIKEPRGLGQQLAFAWPGLFGLELRDVYQAEKPLPGHCEVIFDGGVRLILDPTWSQVADPTEQLVALGRRLAALSMGIGGWGRFAPEEQVAVFVAVVSQFVRGWTMSSHGLPENFNLGKLSKWMEKKGQRVAPYALEISGRFGSGSVERQCRLMSVAVERLACVVIDDPGRALKFAKFPTDGQGLAEAPYAFVLEAPVERIRRIFGIGLNDA